MEAYFKEEPRLEPFRPFIAKILWLKAHTRSPEMEQILAMGGGP